MSNFENERDKLTAHLEELKRKHRQLDEEISSMPYLTPELRQLKTQKLWLKDEIYRIETKLSKEYINGS